MILMPHTDTGANKPCKHHQQICCECYLELYSISRNLIFNQEMTESMKCMHYQILNNLLAKVMIDPVKLILCE